MSQHQRKVQAKIEYEMGIWVLGIGVALFVFGLILAVGYWISFDGDSEKFIMSSIFPITIALGFISFALIVPGAVFVFQGDGSSAKNSKDESKGQVRLPGTPKPVKPLEKVVKSKSQLPRYLIALAIICTISFVFALVVVAFMVT